MTRYRYRSLRRRVSLPGTSVRRWFVVAVGLAVLVAPLAAAAEPYRQTREFREVVTCERTVGDCFDREPASIVGRRTWTTTSTSSDGTSSTTTHYEVSWRRADGSEQAREVSWGLYHVAAEGQPAALRLHRGAVVGVEVADQAQWFLPAPAGQLGYWTYVAHLGLGIALWGLLFGWWDGFFGLAYRTFLWMFIGVTPLSIMTSGLAYGQSWDAGTAFEILFGVLAAAVGGWMLRMSLEM